MCDGSLTVCKLMLMSEDIPNTPNQKYGSGLGMPNASIRPLAIVQIENAVSAKKVSPEASDCAAVGPAVATLCIRAATVRQVNPTS